MEREPAGPMTHSNPSITGAVPFEFERELSRNKVVAPRRERKKTRWNEEEVNAIRAEAHSTGVEEGRTGAEAQAARHLAEHLSLLAASVSTLTGTLTAEHAALRNDACEIVLALTRKLVPALMETAPSREIEAILADAFAFLRAEPRVVVKIAPELEAGLAPRLSEIAAEQGFEGALVVRGDDRIAPGDARIEWAKGEIVRDTPALDTRIEEIVRAHLAAPAHDTPAQTDFMSLMGTDA